jgi:hypothetical protein
VLFCVSIINSKVFPAPDVANPYVLQLGCGHGIAGRIIMNFQPLLLKTYCCRDADSAQKGSLSPSAAAMGLISVGNGSCFCEAGADFAAAAAFLTFASVSLIVYLHGTQARSSMLAIRAGCAQNSMQLTIMTRVEVRSVHGH